MKRSERRDSRNQKIRSEFNVLYAQGLRSEIILSRLAERYFLAEQTIERIVFQRGHYKPQNQDETAC